MRKHSFVRWLSLLSAVMLLTAMLSVSLMPTSAASINDQIKQLEQEQKNLQKELTDAKSSLADSRRQRQLYTNQIDNVKQQINLLDNEISTLNRQIANKNNVIAALEQEIAENREHEQEVRETLGKRLHALAKRGNLSTLQMLMNTENYTDYLIKAKLMEKIAASDQAAIDALEDTLRQIEEKEEEIEQEKKEIEAQKAQTEQMRSTSNTKKKELDQLYRAANASYRQNQAEVAALNKEMEQTEANIKKLLASLNSSGSYTETAMFWPVPTVRATSSGYGIRWGKLHKGVDIANGPVPIYGQNVVAAADGTVIYANRSNSWGGGYGYYCMVDHGKDKNGNQIVTLYAHCSKMLAYVGQKVVGGKTVLGRAGDTGNVTGPHLHFEVRVNGTPVDPLKGYISVNGK